MGEFEHEELESKQTASFSDSLAATLKLLSSLFGLRLNIIAFLVVASSFERFELNINLRCLPSEIKLPSAGGGAGRSTSASVVIVVDFF